MDTDDGDPPALAGPAPVTAARPASANESATRSTASSGALLEAMMVGRSAPCSHIVSDE
mgnify:CR=1 FL=1